MNIRRNSLVLVVLLTFAVSEAFCQQNRASTGEAQVLPFDFVHHIYIPVLINGEEANLLFDPIQDILLDSRFARSHDIPLIGGEEAGYGGPVRAGGAGPREHLVQFARNISLEAGGQIYGYSLTPAIPLDSMMASSLGRHVDGLLGINVFSDFVLAFDFPGERILLQPHLDFEPPPGAAPLSISWIRRRPTVTLTYGAGKRTSHGRFLLDFGMGGTVRFTTTHTDSTDLLSRLHPTFATEGESGLGGSLESRAARLPRLSVGTFNLDSLVVTLAREKSGADFNPPWDGLVGLGLLSRFDIWLDLDSNRLWLRPNRRFSLASEWIYTGMGFMPGKRPLTVNQIAEDSPSEHADFKTGDIIRSVNGQNAAGWNVREWKEELEKCTGQKVVVEVKREDQILRLHLSVASRTAGHR